MVFRNFRLFLWERPSLEYRVAAHDSGFAAEVQRAASRGPACRPTARKQMHLGQPVTVTHTLRLRGPSNSQK